MISKKKKETKRRKKSAQSVHFNEKKIRDHEKPNSDRIEELKDNPTQTTEERTWRYPWEEAWREDLEVKWQ